MLALPVVFRKSASTPVAVFSKPRMLLLSAKLPVAVLLVPSVLLESALAPIAVFATPVVLFTSASSPKNVLPPLRSQSCRQTARACGGSTKQASTNAVRNKPCREGDPVIEFFVTEVLVFIRRIVPFPRLINCASVGLNGERSCREKRPLPDSGLGFLKFCQQSRQLGKTKIVIQTAESGDAWQLLVCFAERNNAVDCAG